MIQSFLGWRYFTAGKKVEMVLLVGWLLRRKKSNQTKKKAKQKKPKVETKSSDGQKHLLVARNN